MQENKVPFDLPNYSSRKPSYSYDKDVENFIPPHQKHSFEEVLSRHALRVPSTDNTWHQEEQRRLTQLRKRRLKAARIRFFFFFICFASMVFFLVFNFSSNLAVKRDSWPFTTLDAWISPLLLAYMILTIYLDAKSQLHRHWFIHRDRLYSLCITFSLLTSLFFLFVALPFTHRYRHLETGCTADDESCVSLAGIIMITASHVFPLLFCVMMSKVVNHQYSFRNKWLEIGIAVFYLGCHIAWVVVCNIVSGTWPYHVYRDLGPEKFTTWLVHLGSFVLLLILYIIGQWVHNRQSQSKFMFQLSSSDRLGTAAFSKTMLNNIEKDLEVIPAAPDFTIQTY